MNRLPHHYSMYLEFPLSHYCSDFPWDYCHNVLPFPLVYSARNKKYLVFSLFWRKNFQLSCCSEYSHGFHSQNSHICFQLLNFEKGSKVLNDFCFFHILGLMRRHQEILHCYDWKPWRGFLALREKVHRKRIWLGKCFREAFV